MEDQVAEQTQDIIEYLDNDAVIHHGTYNDRIYLMKPGSDLSDDLPQQLIAMASAKGYSKIFAKVPASAVKLFIRAGFDVEAEIPGFYSGTEAALFLGHYLSQERAVEENPQKLDDILKLAMRKQRRNAVGRPLNEKFFLRPCLKHDTEEMAEIYGKVFPSYPFPIHDPEYLCRTMESHVDYFGVEAEGELVALASSEMDMDYLNVEMTDFATLPKWRGCGFGLHLLRAMEEAMRRKSIKTAYTIARSVSPGMNITFAKQNYKYGGRLKNNTNISGRIESMNIWYKAL
jgi:putative beta-lysine N-acetyltransferase